MNLKPIAVALTLLVAAVGGVAAVNETNALTSDQSASTAGGVAVETSYENDAVTVSVTQDGAPVEGASVEVADAERTTDANGTVVVENASVEDELDVEVEADSFEAELSYALSDGDLTIQEEEYEYGVENADDEDAETEDEETEESEEDADDVADADDEETETEN